MKNKKNQDLNLLIKIFKRRKRLIATSFVVNILLVFTALAFVGLKFLYPYHFIIGVSIYIFSFIPLFYRLYISRKTFNKFKTYKFAKSYYSNKKRRFIYGLIAVITILSFLAVRPIGKSALSDLSKEEASSLIEEDLKKSILAMDYLEVSGEKLLGSLSVSELEASSSENIRNNFKDFIEAVIFSESLTETHRYFNDISIFNMKEERAKSFMISYSLYIKKYEILHRMILSTSGNDSKKKILNEYIEIIGRNGVFTEMTSRFYEPKTRLRINLGRGYMRLFYEKDTTNYGEGYTILQKKSKSSYTYLFKNFGKTVFKFSEIFSDQTENKMFDAWFPIQKNVANTMGHVIFMGRKGVGFITQDQILEMKKHMQPGDIMLQRRNWHLSNVGIPGFWTHAAIYTGTLEDMDQYFSGIFPLEGYDKFSSYLKERRPKVYEKYLSLDEEQRMSSVIEAIEPGVILQSLEKSAKADFISVLRPRLDKKDKLLSLLRAFENFGKPYDYDFDFETRDALVCSELVYDSYVPIKPEKNGINMDLSVVNGRKMVSPLDIAGKYKNERTAPDRELDFVYFLQGDEQSKKAFISTEEKFIESLSWSKFSFLQ